MGHADIAAGEWPADPNMKPCTNTPIAIMVNESIWPPLTSSGEGIRFVLSFSNDLW